MDGEISAASLEQGEAILRLTNYCGLSNMRVIMYNFKQNENRVKEG